MMLGKRHSCKIELNQKNPEDHQFYTLNLAGNRSKRHDKGSKKGMSKYKSVVGNKIGCV